MSPEIKKQSVESPAKLIEGLRDSFESTKLDPGKVFELTSLALEKDQMASCGNESERVYQDLRAVINAGGKEMFFVLDSTTMVKTEDSNKPKFVKSTIITRRNPNGERADFVGFLKADGKKIDIGRQFQRGMDGTLSNNHLSIAQAQDGSIGIIDNGSTNGTEIFSPKKQPKGAKFGFVEEKPSKEWIELSSKPNPVEDFTIWSVPSHYLKEHAQAIQSYSR